MPSSICFMVDLKPSLFAATKKVNPGGVKESIFSRVDDIFLIMFVIKSFEVSQ